MKVAFTERLEFVGIDAEQDDFNDVQHDVAVEHVNERQAVLGQLRWNGRRTAFFVAGLLPTFALPFFRLRLIFLRVVIIERVELLVVFSLQFILSFPTFLRLLKIGNLKEISFASDSFPENLSPGDKLKLNTSRTTSSSPVSLLLS